MLLCCAEATTGFFSFGGGTILGVLVGFVFTMRGLTGSGLGPVARAFTMGLTILGAGRAGFTTFRVFIGFGRGCRVDFGAGLRAATVFLGGGAAGLMAGVAGGGRVVGGGGS